MEILPQEEILILVMLQEHLPPYKSAKQRSSTGPGHGNCSLTCIDWQGKDGHGMGVNGWLVLPTGEADPA